MIRPRREAICLCSTGSGNAIAGFAALRRAGRAAIVMPAMFALGDLVIGNPTFATFAAFGSFAMLLLVDFAGPMRARLQAQAALAVAGARVRLPRARWLRARRGSRRSRWRSSRSASSSPASSARSWRARRRRCCSRSSSRSRCRHRPRRSPTAWPAGGRVGGVAARDRAAVAGAGARSGARRGDRGAAGRWRRGCARRSRYRLSGGTDPSPSSAMPRSRGPTRRSRRCTRLLRDAVPADRAEHRGAGGRAAGRRAALARTRSSCSAAPAPDGERVDPRACAVQARGGRGARARRRPARRAAARRPTSCTRRSAELRARARASSSAAPPVQLPAGALGRRRRDLRARPELPRAGAELRRLADRREHRPRRRRGAAQLARPAARPPARRARRPALPPPRSAPAPTSSATRCGCRTASAARSASASRCWSPTSPASSTPSGSCSARCRCCAPTR